MDISGTFLHIVSAQKTNGEDVIGLAVSQQKPELMLYKINCSQIKGAADLNSVILPIYIALAHGESTPHGLLCDVGIRPCENHS